MLMIPIYVGKHSPVLLKDQVFVELQSQPQPQLLSDALHAKPSSILASIVGSSLMRFLRIVMDSSVSLLIFFFSFRLL